MMLKYPQKYACVGSICNLYFYIYLRTNKPKVIKDHLLHLSFFHEPYLNHTVITAL